MHDRPVSAAARGLPRSGALRRALVHGAAAAALLAQASCGGGPSLGSLGGSSSGGVSSLASSLGSGFGSGGSSSLASALPSSASTAASALSGGGGAASSLTSAAQPALSALGGAASSAASALTGPSGTHVVQVRVTATSDANATQSGQGAPVVVRIYQLGSSSAFDNAEFFRLLNGDSAALGADLIGKDELLVAPGASKTQSLTLSDRVRSIGVFAAFRDFQRKTWRLTLPVPSGAATVPVSVMAAGLAAGT